MQAGPRGICTVEGCGKVLAGHGLCMTHYVRWRKHGDPLKVIKRVAKPRPKCRIDGCNQLVPTKSARGLCDMHYQRWRKDGRPGEAERRRARDGEGTVLTVGYRWHHAKGLEHRTVIERTLGRKLRTDECVHHKNGNKLDNRPENLEVMTRSEHMKHHAAHGQGKSGRFKKRKEGERLTGH